MDDPDRVRRFALEGRPIRGHVVRLAQSWQALREHQQYPPAVLQLLGEAVAAAALLAATLKFSGTLTLQMQGKGLINLLVAQCTHDFQLRGMARHEPIEGEADFGSLTGAGQILVTVESNDRASSYQGVVPIAGTSLAESLEAYFLQSEQLPTRVQLAASADMVAGMLVQRVPGVGGHQAQIDESTLAAAWSRVERAMSSQPCAELLLDDEEQRLINMFGADEVRVFQGQAVRFECRCSRDRVANVLRSLGIEEVRAVIAEQGACTVTCEFCRKPYKFDAIDVAQLFAQTFSAGSDSIN